MRAWKEITPLILSLCILSSMLNHCVAEKTDSRKRKPNILFIAIDDLNDWNEVLKGDSQARTPNMERLASKGIVFTNAHCSAPACGPSRSAIMSGIRPSTSGNYVNKSSLIHNPVLNNSVLLPEFFQQNEYYVCGAGKLFHGYHFTNEVKGRGFHDYFPSKTQDLPSWEGLKFSSKLPLGGWSRTADWGPCHPEVTVDDHPDGITANWVTKQLLSGKLKEPFFLGAGIFQPHLPNYAPQKYFDRFPLSEIKFPEGFKENDLDDVPAAHAKMAHNPWLQRIRSTGQWKPAIQAYLACTSMVDELVGQIVESLEQSAYADNTIIVLWSDHGFHLGEKQRWSKYSLWERATRVNLIWVVPNITTPGSICNKPVNLLDIYPTLASLTNCQAPSGQLEGNDLSPLMKDPESSWDKNSLTVFGFKNYSVRSTDHRYIVYEDGSEELYDHTQDQWEWHNLANEPKYQELKYQMRAQLPKHHEPPGPTYIPPPRRSLTPKIQTKE